MYKMSEVYVWKEIGERVVILNLDSGRYFTCNPACALVWKGVMNGDAAETVAKRICREYDVSESEALRDVEDAISQFLAGGMLVGDG